MNTILYFALLLLLIVAPFYLTYGLLLRRPLIRQFRREINECRDNVEMLVCCAKLPESDESIRILRRRCHNAHQSLDKVDITHALLASTSAQKALQEAKISDERAILDKGISEVQSIAKRMDEIMLKAFVVNSPMAVTLTAAIVLFAIFFSGFGNTCAKVARKAWAAATYDPTRRNVIA